MSNRIHNLFRDDAIFFKDTGTKIQAYLLNSQQVKYCLTILISKSELTNISLLSKNRTKNEKYVLILPKKRVQL